MLAVHAKASHSVKICWLFEPACVFQGGLLEVAAEEVLPVLQVLDNGQQAGT